MSETSIKNVTFDSISQVILIPAIQEYKDAKIHKDVWYNRYEMHKLLNKYKTELTLIHFLKRKTVQFL